MSRPVIDLDTLEIRPAKAEEDGPIKQMVRQARLDPTSLHWEHFLVAEYAGEVIAIGQVKQYPGCQELGSLYTRPRYQGLGIATRVMNALEARAGRPLYLLCMEKMVPFYQQHGYETIRWWQAPWFLKLKMSPVMLARLVGVRVYIMRKI